MASPLGIRGSGKLLRKRLRERVIQEANLHRLIVALQMD